MTGTRMALELLIDRWFGIGAVVFGISHLLHPGRWAALYLPLRETPAGGLLLATFNLPLGLGIVLAHNLWVWDARVIVTVAGWVMILKSVVYLLFPRALSAAMPSGKRMERAFTIAGATLTLLGACLIYDSFTRR